MISTKIIEEPDRLDWYNRSQ